MTHPPYASTLVPFVTVLDGELKYANDRDSKIALCMSQDQVFCFWPGQYRTEMFEVDKAVALVAVGGESDGYPPVGARYMQEDWDGTERIFEVTEVLKIGGRPCSVETVPESPGIRSSTGFGTAQSWRSWVATATRLS